MLRIKKTHLSILLGSLLCFNSCSKDAGLTKATQEGANTFSCKVNGKKYIPAVSLFGGDPIYSQYRLDPFISGTNKLIIGTTVPSNPVQHISITIYGCDKTGVYDLNEDTLYKIDAEYDLNAGGYNAYAKVYINKKGSSGQVEITKLDKIRKIVSGTFSFKLTDENNISNTVSIERGRFDLKYDQ